MNRFKRLAPALFVALLFATCIGRKAMTFDQNAIYSDPIFFSKIVEIAKEKKHLHDTAKQEGSILFYRVKFSERQVENGNIVDYSNISDTTLAVPYMFSSGDYQELYLANLPMNNAQDNLYVYYSLNYSYQGTTKAKVVSFGPAYLGQLVQCPADPTKSQIEFFATLESQRKAPFILEKTNETTKLKFVLEKSIPNSCIVVNKIVQAGRNKIGGSNPLVFNVDSILGHNALNFQIVPQ